MDCRKSFSTTTNVFNSDDNKALNKADNWEYSLESYSKWKFESSYRNLCSSKELEKYDIRLSQIAIHLMKIMNVKVTRLWNSAGGLVAFNPKNFNVMITEHFWSSCYENLFKARYNLEQSLRKKMETIYVCPNIFDILNTSDEVLMRLINSWEYLLELEALLVLHRQGRQYSTFTRSPIVGIDKERPEHWTPSHVIVYFQICNCYIVNIIKEILERMNNYFLMMRAVDSIDFHLELLENSDERLRSSEQNKSVRNEVEKIVSKPKKLKVGQPCLHTISEELPTRAGDSSLPRLFRQLSYQSCSSLSASSSTSTRSEILSLEDTTNIPRNFNNNVQLNNHIVISVTNDKICSEDVLEPVGNGFKKPEPLPSKKQKYLSSFRQMQDKLKMSRIGRRTVFFVLQKLKKNAKSFDSMWLA